MTVIYGYLVVFSGICRYWDPGINGESVTELTVIPRTAIIDVIGVIENIVNSVTDSPLIPGSDTTKYH